MTILFNEEGKKSRAEALEGPGATLNGIKLVFVTLDTSATPPHALLDVEFCNANGLSAVLSDVQNNVLLPREVFQIRGGSRIPAGTEPEQVHVRQITTTSSPTILRARVEPIGDYSTYTLRVLHGAPPNQLMDPLFDQIGFKFRPGCFNVNCAPEWTPSPVPPVEPVIDYLAKDFDSFKHVLINAMMERVPQWAPTSEADMDQVLIDLIAADADELSDFQDRVMNEAYLGRVRKRVSLARYARLMDYHIHQGNQASTWMAFRVAATVTLPAGFGVWTGTNWDTSGSVIFITQDERTFHPCLNDLDVYRWDGIVSALEAGSTHADLALPTGFNNTQSGADSFRDLLRSDDVRHLVIEEKLNPETGTINGRDIAARQLLRLLEGEATAETRHDPSTPAGGTWMVRVHWRSEDRLRRRYCFTTWCKGNPVGGISAFHGNLAQVAHGRPHKTVFRQPGCSLPTTNAGQLTHVDGAYYERTAKWGTLCRLPHAPLAFRNHPLPGGQRYVYSTLDVTVDGTGPPWEEQSDLIESAGDDPHFIVETDERGVSTIRFGNGVNGRTLPQDADVSCRYQIGQGSDGNVGADSLTGFDSAYADVISVWNPFDVVDGRSSERPEVVIRRVPQAYRARQLRAVTLNDYVKRAEGLKGVSKAHARYAWTGSWRTVRVSIDPVGVTTLDDKLREEIEGHLNAVRLIGEDLEIRGAHYVSLDIKMRLCAHPQYWPEDLAHVLEIEFSDGHTPDGRLGFFHPDRWTFGQTLHASQLVGRALAVPGVERVLLVSMRRWNVGFGPSTATISVNPEDLPELEKLRIDVEPFEIIRVENDPNHVERGRILFDVRGGRR